MSKISYIFVLILFSLSAKSTNLNAHCLLSSSESLFSRQWVSYFMAKYKFTKEQLEDTVKHSKSIAEVCRKLNIRAVGGNYKTLHYKFKIFNINTSHFTGSAWNIGLKFKPKPPRPLKEILIENSDFLSSTHLKKRLFREKVKEERCENCGLTEWLGCPISLELNHINGKNLDHRIENLEILCPNCHSQTSTFRGKTKKSNRNEKRSNAEIGRQEALKKP